MTTQEMLIGISTIELEKRGIMFAAGPPAPFRRECRTTIRSRVTWRRCALVETGPSRCLAARAQES